MITRIPKRSASAVDLLDYLRGRGPEERGRLLDTNVPGGRVEWALTIERVSSHRRRLDDYVKHLILAFAPGERIPDEDLRSIARFYLETMGYGQAPYVAYLHTDRAHPHLHIVTTPTTWDGRAISESWEWKRSERVAREIERRWGLVAVPSSDERGLKAPDRRETERASTEHEPLHRTAFQYEIASAAKESRTLHELLERLEARGFRVRVQLDREGELRGISFSRGDLAFRGSQLGKDFRARALLERFELGYDPRRDRSQIETFLARQAARLEDSMSPTVLNAQDLYVTISDRLDEVDRRLANGGGAYLVEERERLTRDLARLQENPATPASALESLPRPAKSEGLPAGTYTIAVVDPKALPGGKLTDEQVPQVRQGWSLETVEKARGWIEGQNRAHDVLVRPQGLETTILGFRGVEESQLNSMRQHGFEPAITVRAGERYDVVFKTHTIFNSDELEAARRVLASAYELQPTWGVFRDAVHLPGTQAHPQEGQSVKVELVELRQEPFSRSEELLAEARLRVEAREIHRRAVDLDLPKLAEHAPAAVAGEALREEARLPYPPGEPLEGLQRAIDNARAELSPERPHAALSDEQLSRRLEELNQNAVGHALSGKDPQLEAPEKARELVALEGELAHRRRDAELPLLEAEARLEAASRTLDTKIESRAPAEEIRQAAREYSDFSDRHQAAERAYLEVAHAQVENDRERLWAVLQQKEIPEAGIKAYEQYLERSLDLAARTGREVPVPELGTATHPAARIEEEIFGRVLAAREAAQGLEQPEFRGAAAKDPDLAALLAQHARDVRVGAAENELRTAPNTREEKLRDAAERIGRGDLSPDTLRKAATATLGIEPGAALSTPRELPRSTEALAERYQSLREGIQAKALEIQASPGDRDLASLKQFFSQTTEMVRLHQKIQEHERMHLGLAEPPKAGEKGFREQAVAWLERALEKGLEKNQAAAHLSNRIAQPFLAAGKAAPSFALSAASFASRIAMNAALNHVRQVMHS